MQLELIRHLWGVTTDFIATMPSWKEFGYSGIELGANLMTEEITAAAKRK